MQEIITMLENITDRYYRTEENLYEGYVPRRNMKPTEEWKKSSDDFAAMNLGEKLAKVLPPTRTIDGVRVDDRSSTDETQSYPQ